MRAGCEAGPVQILLFRILPRKSTLVFNNMQAAIFIDSFCIVIMTNSFVRCMIII